MIETYFIIECEQSDSSTSIFSHSINVLSRMLVYIDPFDIDTDADTDASVMLVLMMMMMTLFVLPIPVPKTIPIPSYFLSIKKNHFSTEFFIYSLIVTFKWIGWDPLHCYSVRSVTCFYISVIKW